jgi:hypothetical protein
MLLRANAHKSLAAALVAILSLAGTLSGWIATGHNVALSDSPLDLVLERLGIQETDEAPPPIDADEARRIVVEVEVPQPLSVAEVRGIAPFVKFPAYLPTGYRYTRALATPLDVHLFYDSGRLGEGSLEIVQISLPVGGGERVLRGRVSEIEIGDYEGVYVDGFWVATQLEDGQELPVEWRKDVTHFVLFDRDGVRTYVIAQPWDGEKGLTREDLIKIATSLQ